MRRRRRSDIARTGLWPRMSGVADLFAAAAGAECRGTGGAQEEEAAGFGDRDRGPDQVLAVVDRVGGGNGAECAEGGPGRVINIETGNAEAVCGRGDDKIEFLRLLPEGV